MNEVMNWITHYNTLIIQSGFTIVLILVAIYVYRLFFVNSMADLPEHSNVDLSGVHQKLNQLLQAPKTLAPGTPVQSTGAMPETTEQIEKLKNEVVTLRAQLNESEKKVFEMTPSNAAGTTPEVSSAAASSTDQTQQINELNKKIEGLQTRLSEYDIISDDIAELSQLRAENAALKGLTNPSAAPVMPETAPAAPEPEPATELNLNISESEKNLLSDFEKSTQKG